MLKRVEELEFECNAKRFSTFLRRVYKKFPKFADEWNGTLEYLYENGLDKFTDNYDNFGNLIPWSYSINLDIMPDYKGGFDFYFAFIRREEVECD